MAHPDLMIQTGRVDSPKYPSPRTARSQSLSSDKASLSSHNGLLSPPVATSPEPAFIAASTASQIVTNNHDSHSDDWFDQHGIHPSGETTLVALPALKLVNSFLDQLLFNFLSVARSTALAHLRPAVIEVLKPKLAKDAIYGADQELREYMGGGEDDELLAFSGGLEAAKDWDLELAWKRTRLRCMVYSSLGDMEEEDEDFYTEQEYLNGPSNPDDELGEEDSSVVSPAVAIFLTAILEFMGEQVLVVAGQASYHRLRARHEKEARQGTSTPAEIAERVVVEETDMEKVALDRTLGRLWRGWKKRIRSPTTNSSISVTRSFSRESLKSLRKLSGASNTADERGEMPVPSLATVLAEHELAAMIPLPMSDDDVREIEIPGLVAYDDENAGPDEEMGIETKPRPKSLMIFPYPMQGLPTPESSKPGSPVIMTAPRKRANSLPSPATSFYPLTSKRNKLNVDKAVEEQETSQAEDASMKSPEDTVAETSEDDGNGSSVGSPDEQIKDQPTPSSHADHGLVAGAIASAAAVGSAAVAGISAVAKGEAPQTSLDEETTDGEEVFTEEPQVMTSSRVSICGRVSPDAGNISSRPASIRAPSVHSLCLIDVASPRSPRSPIDGSDIIPRVISISRSNSLHSPNEAQSPRIASPIMRGNSPLARTGSAISSSQARNSAGESMSEAEEDKEGSGLSTTASTDPNPRMSVMPADLAAAMQGVDLDPSPTSQHYVPRPLDKDGNKPPTISIPIPPPRHSGRENSYTPAKTPSPMSGPHPLSPLREAREGGPNTSDKTSSPVRKEVKGGSDVHHGHSSSPSQNRNQRSMDGHKSTHHQKQTYAPAGAPRSSPPRPSRDEIMRKAVPESTPRAQRPITSSSSSSGNSHKLRPVRTSEDSIPSTSDHPSHNFEDLIRSDQTIQYTLTPQNMRNIESPDSSRSGVHIHVERPGTRRSRTSSVTKLTGLNSNSPASPVDAAKSISSAKSSRPSRGSTIKSGPRLRSNVPQPRDARVDRDSMGDFSEFIRSTGPAKSMDEVLSETSFTTSNGHKGVNGSPRNASGSMLLASPRRSLTSGPRSKLEARDAVVGHDSITELIDFVRAGPVDEGDHRIPRTVAPFRTTMDSDQMSGAIGGRAVDALHSDARNNQLYTNQSLYSSMASQTPLLNNHPSKTEFPKSNKPVSNGNHKQFDDDEDIMPKRKTRRVRDPYAIDFSDEDDTPAPQEESLADFLRNAPPPPEDPTSTSVFDSVPKPKKKSSFGSRWSRSAPPMPPPKSAPRSTSTSSSSSISPNPPRLPVPKHAPISAQFASNGNYGSQLDTARNPPAPPSTATSKVSQKSYQPRDAVQASSRTSDLADFLMNSKPPPNSQPKTLATLTEEKESGGLASRMFGRRKKVAGY